MLLTHVDVPCPGTLCSRGGTSGHPLWQCSEQPIIYSTLISTHVNPHQSSPAQGGCVAAVQRAGRAHGASRRRHSGLELNLPSHQAGSPRQGCNQLSLSKPIRGPRRKRSAGRELIGHNARSFPRPRNTPEARYFSSPDTAQRLPQSGRAELQAGFVPESAECRAAGRESVGTLPAYATGAMPHRPSQYDDGL